MPLYQYQALDEHGRRKKGLIEAQGERDAKDKLRDMKIMVVSLSPKTDISSKQNLKGEKLVGFTMQLSQLVGAGVPLYESLLAIEKQCRNERHHRIVLSLCDQIKAGVTLSRAMSQYPESFNKLYCSMISAGEAAGALNAVLEKLSQLLARQIKLKSDIITALVYPAILGSFSLLIILMLLGFVVPSIEGIFEGRKLNGFTQFILSTSHFFREYWWIYIPLIALLIGGLFYLLRRPQGKLWIERSLLRIPILRTLVIQTAVARFTRTMGTLLHGGLPLIDALQISRGVMRNHVMEDEIKHAEARIIEGSTLGTELGRAKWFPSMVAQMLAVGEESGNSVLMLNKIADMYEQDLEKTLARVVALAQPVILIFMGAIIGSILLAILLPLTDIGSLTGM